MKKIEFYTIIAVIAFIEVALFWLSVRIREPLPSILAVLFGIAVIYVAKMYVDEIIEDERTQAINEKTAIRTLQITWIALFVFSLWMIIEGIGNRVSLELRRLGQFGFGLLMVLCGMIVVYILLSFYYGKKYGE